MGPAGSGKTTLGKLLAEKLRWPFYDGDEFQSKNNLGKMAEGVSLTDEDREPWLKSLRNLVHGVIGRGGQCILASSLLKQAYRDLVLEGLPDAALVYLKGDYGILETRLQNRVGHFFGAGLLASQMEILEEPETSLVLPIDIPLDQQLIRMREAYGL